MWTRVGPRNHVLALVGPGAIVITQYTTRISIQTVGLAFGSTGLCTYRVRGVDGSCAKHLTVESYMVIYAANSYTYYY